MSTIADGIARVRDTIVDACARANRDPSEVTLVAVSKKKPGSDVIAAAAAGVQHFGENRVEEAEIKIPDVNAQLDTPVTWHMVGHIQSRKAKLIQPLFSVVHSVDKVKLARKLAESMPEGQQLDVLLEINISGEEAKYGFAAAGWQTDKSIRDRLWQEFDQVLRMPSLNVRGLMTMAPIVENAEATRPVFAGLAELREALATSFDQPLPDLSMGMTDDYPVAIEEGATIVRVGRAIFGERT